MFFVTAALVLDRTSSTIIAVGSGLGTPVWSTASRGMWAHTWEIMLGSLVAYLLLSAELRPRPIRPLVLSTLLSWMFFVRPTGAVPIVFVCGYVYTRRRSEFALLVGIGAAWAAAFVAYSWSVFGTLMPFYYLSFVWPSPWESPPPFQRVIALYGSLVSPSRGIFIYCPVVVWVLWASARFRQSIETRALASVALLTAAGIWLLIILQRDWPGGACYGPRLFTDAVPWLVLLAIMAIAAIPRLNRTVRNPMIAAGAFLMLLSIAMNAIGAFSFETMAWNFTGPVPEIMLDWSRPQFLAGWLDKRR
jgi:hypothetical protein